MKKTTAVMIAAVLVITLGGTTAFAFDHTARSVRQDQTPVATTVNTRYNQDNECPYCENPGHCFNDSDGDGICDYYNANDTASGSSCQYAGHVSAAHHNGAGRHYDGTGHHAGHGYGHR